MIDIEDLKQQINRASDKGYLESSYQELLLFVLIGIAERLEVVASACQTYENEVAIQENRELWKVKG